MEVYWMFRYAFEYTIMCTAGLLQNVAYELRCLNVEVPIYPFVLLLISYSDGDPAGTLRYAYVRT